jgi:hypothetical protein
MGHEDVHLNLRLNYQSYETIYLCSESVGQIGWLVGFINFSPFVTLLLALSTRQKSNADMSIGLLF